LFITPVFPNQKVLIVFNAKAPRSERIGVRAMSSHKPAPKVVPARVTVSHPVIRGMDARSKSDHNLCFAVNSLEYDIVLILDLS